MIDIAVIGGGAAGLSAAIYAARAGKSVTVIEKDTTGGQITYSPLVENYPGIAKMTGADFAESLTAQAESFGAQIEYGEVSGIKRLKNGFRVCGDVELEAGSVILALGAEHRRLGLEKEEELTGCGVSYCAVCDGAFYEGANVAVFGGGNTALQDALFLSGSCATVTVIHRRDVFRGDDSLVKKLAEKENVKYLMSHVVTGLQEENGELVSITVKDLKSGHEQPLIVQGLFIAIGQVPKTDAFAGLVKTDAAGYLQAGENCGTSVPGIFAAGDCRTKEVRQLTTAAADGAVAALAACRFLDAAR